MALLVGIAISQGTFTGTAEALPELLPPPLTVPSDKAPITIDELLTMTGGVEWDESTAAGYNAWALAPNQVDYVLAKPMAHPPGTWFQYSSGAVHLLSVGLALATG